MPNSIRLKRPQLLFNLMLYSKSTNLNLLQINNNADDFIDYNGVFMNGSYENSTQVIMCQLK